MANTRRIAATFANIPFALHVCSRTFNPGWTIVERLRPFLGHCYAFLPSACNVDSKFSIVRCSCSVFSSFGLYHSCKMNLAAVCANGWTSSSSIHDLPVVVSRYDGIDSINGKMISSLSGPSSLKTWLIYSFHSLLYRPMFKWDRYTKRVRVSVITTT